MIKVLVTGGAGNVGSALSKALVSSGKYQVLVADNLITGDVENYHKFIRISHLSNVMLTITMKSLQSCYPTGSIMFFIMRPWLV